VGVFELVEIRQAEVQDAKFDITRRPDRGLEGFLVSKQALLDVVPLWVL